jgi:hypothetical protein
MVVAQRPSIAARWQRAARSAAHPRTNPEREHTILATDPEIGIEWPVTDSVRMSTRDREAPTLQHVRGAGLLPAWVSRRV